MIELDVNKTIFPLIIGIVLIFVGLVAANIAGGIGEYTISILNESTGGKITINLLNSNIISMMGTVALFAGLTLVVYALALIIWALLKSVRGSMQSGMTGT